MTLLVDTSVLVKWFHEEGEQQVREARELLARHRAGGQRLLVLDLGLYELGNVLLRALGQPAQVVADAIEAVRLLCGPVVHPRPSWLPVAVRLAERHTLTFYDAAWAATAQALDLRLVTSDRRLLATPFGVSPAAALTET